MQTSNIYLDYLCVPTGFCQPWCKVVSFVRGIHSSVKGEILQLNNRMKGLSSTREAPRGKKGFYGWVSYSTSNQTCLSNCLFWTLPWSSWKPVMLWVWKVFLYFPCHLVIQIAWSQTIIHPQIECRDDHWVVMSLPFLLIGVNTIQSNCNSFGRDDYFAKCAFCFLVHVQCRLGNSHVCTVRLFFLSSLWKVFARDTHI